MCDTHPPTSPTHSPHPCTHHSMRTRSTRTVCCAHASVAPPPKPCAHDSWRIAWLKPPEQGGLSCKMCLSLWVAGQSAPLAGLARHRACTTPPALTAPHSPTHSQPHPSHPPTHPALTLIVTATAVWLLGCRGAPHHLHQGPWHQHVSQVSWRGPVLPFHFQGHLVQGELCLKFRACVCL